ncbi:hypothetical protein SASPL_133423 [Salvia splendens]|uniref:Protein FAR1-RELATED SEQUENCE n=1 Tax=Salvia splendens TaxID=180675 RepID=A0A8X8X465_SALSN|nr:hypothetical protein SASPL_133423 [Salvia splendens]
MEFETEVEAYDFYMKYAKATGFGTRKKSAHKDPITGKLLDISFCCCKEGFRATDSRAVTVKGPRSEIRCFREMSNVQQTQVDVAQSCGLPPKKILDVMSKESGGIQHLGFTHIDLKNYLRTKRTSEIKQGDCGDAMMGKRPKTILIDQDQAMSAALASKWPSTYHRLCVWHIFQNAAIHLSSVFSSFKNTFAADFSRCVYDFEEESKLLWEWNEMLIDDSCEKEAAEDLKNAQSSTVMTFPLEILKHGAAIYTHKIFALFNEELREGIRKQDQDGRKFEFSGKAAESEDSYAYAMECLLKMGNDIDGMVEKGKSVAVEAKVGDVATEGECDENQIKGLKPKGRVTYKTCKRPKNTLEQAISKKRKPKAIKSGVEHASSTRESEGIVIINDDYWNLMYTAFDPQNTS